MFVSKIQKSHQIADKILVFWFKYIFFSNFSGHFTLTRFGLNGQNMRKKGNTNNFYFMIRKL